MDYASWSGKGLFVGRARDDQEVLTYYLEERSNDIYHALSAALSHAQASRSERYG